MPYIPGSSIKGVIADVFRRAVDGRDNERQGYNEYLQAELRKVHNGDDNRKEVDIERLLKNIFEGIKKEDVRNSEYEPISGRDIFYDAHIIKSSGNVLGLDNITPHNYAGVGERIPGNNSDFDLDHMPLFEPTPITILRIMPGVTFKFYMKLHDLNIDNRIKFNAKQKKLLFIRILTDFGIGAKTNIGYGRLVQLK